MLLVSVLSVNPNDALAEQQQRRWLERKITREHKARFSFEPLLAVKKGFHRGWTCGGGLVSEFLVYRCSARDCILILGFKIRWPSC